MFGLVDCNNFFVSCERTVDPSLNGRPVVVLSNNDGCVVARSNEAKRLGVKMGQPAFEIKELIQTNRLIALSGNHLLYRDLSIKVHDIFRLFAPSTQDYSVDEAFLNMEGIPLKELKPIGEAIVKRCMDELQLPVTVGFAPTKTLAKIVTETCKKAGRSVGIAERASTASPVMRRLPISELWGIGRRQSKKLYLAGVHTIADFAEKDPHWVRAMMGVVGERSWLELQGIPCIELDHVGRQIQDSISESRTFPEDIRDFDYIRARISIYTADCARKLRRMQGLCREIGVFLSTNPFRTDIPRMSVSDMVRLEHPTNDTMVLTNATQNILSLIYRDIPFKRAGVWMGEINPGNARQPDLFTPPKEARRLLSRQRLMRTIDNINSGPGIPGLKLASQLTSGHPGHNDGYSSSFQAPH